MTAPPSYSRRNEAYSPAPSLPTIRRCSPPRERNRSYFSEPLTERPVAATERIRPQAKEQGRDA